MAARPEISAPYDMRCPIARTLDIIGERWTILILRDLVVGGPQKFQDFQQSLAGIASSTSPSRRDRSKIGAPMMTGRKIANGVSGIGIGLIPARNTPLIAAPQITASHNVNGIITASHTLRRCAGVSPVRSSPSHKPSAIRM